MSIAIGSTRQLRGLNVQRLFGSQRALKTVEDFTEFEQRAAYFDGIPADAARKGTNLLERGSQVHFMAAMLVGEDAYFMLLTSEKFVSFSNRPLADPRPATGALFTLGVDSREAVDAMVNQAVAVGGTPAHEPQDHGCMYDWGFYDLDGHGWGVFWMDPTVVQG